MMPRRSAMRRAAACRCAVMSTMLLRATAKMAGDAVSGVPALNGGSDQSAGAHGENALCARRLGAYPGQNALLLHQCFLPVGARNVEHVQLWRISEFVIGRQS